MNKAKYKCAKCGREALLWQCTMCGYTVCDPCGEQDEHIEDESGCRAVCPECGEIDKWEEVVN